MVVPLDIGADRDLRLVEGVIGPGELVVGGGKFAVGVAAAADPTSLEALFGEFECLARLVDVSSGGGEPVTLPPGGLLQYVGYSSGRFEGGLEPVPVGGVGRGPLLRRLQLVVGLVSELLEPVGDVAPSGLFPLFRRWRTGVVLFGEV